MVWKFVAVLALVCVWQTGVLEAGHGRRRHHSQYTPEQVLAFCTRMGSACTTADACDTETNFFKGNCGDEKSCCLPKRTACTELKKGICTTAADCETREGYHLSDINCDATTKCCRPDHKRHGRPEKQRRHN